MHAASAGVHELCAGLHANIGDTVLAALGRLEFEVSAKAAEASRGSLDFAPGMSLAAVAANGTVAPI